MSEFDVGEITLDSLRQRTSAKWRVYDPDVIPAWLAEMDYPLAAPIAAALHAAIDRSDVGYRFIGELPEALAEHALATWGWVVDPAHVVVLPDVLTSVAQSISALTAPGEGVVVNTPVYPPFFSTIRDICGRVIVDVPLLRDPDDRYELDLDGLATAFAQPEVTAYLLCSPHNPTGITPSAETLAAIAALALEHGVAVIADEIHAQLAHPGTVHTPFLTVASDGLTAVSLVSASKAWNIAGAKCAQVVAGSQPVMDILAERVPLEVTYATGHFGVLAAIAAYRDGGPWLEQVRTQIAANALTVHERVVESMPAVRYAAPTSSYLGWMDLSAYGIGDDPSGFFLEHARVALSAGPTFGQGGDGFVRLNFGTSPAILDEILARMSRSLAVRGAGA